MGVKEIIQYECYCCGEMKPATEIHFFEDEHRHGIGVVSVCLEDKDDFLIHEDVNEISELDFLNKSQ